MVFVILFLFTAFNPSNNVTEQAIYDRGLTYLEQGNVDAALDTWAEAKFKLNEPSLIIGFSFLEQATRHKLESRYIQATDMYFWGLGDWNTTRHSERKELEISYLKVILSEDEIKDFESFSLENPALQYDWVRQFWVANDPVATTVENERLLEHWERIAYAQKTFTKRSDTVFGTDERGVYHVRYGQPDRLINGTFGLTLNRLLHLIRLKLNANVNTYQQYYGVSANDSYLVASNYARLFERTIFQFFGEDRFFELWIFEDENNNYENTLMFGEDYSGEYRHLNAPDEMIHPVLFDTYSASSIGRYSRLSQEPTLSSQFGDMRRFGLPRLNPAFDVTNYPRTNLQLSPALLIQYHMYERLALETFLYEDIFYEIENRFASDRLFTKYDGYIIRDITLGKFKKNMSRFEYQYSTITEDLPKLTFSHKPYRIIRNGKPAVLLAKQIHSGEQIFADMTYNYPEWFDESKKPLDTRLFDYEIKSGIQILDENNRVKAYKLISLDVDSVVAKSTTQSSIFEFPVLEHAALKLITQLNNHTEGTQPVTQTVLPDHFRAYNEQTLELNLAPDLKTEKFELSDIIVGFKLPHQEYDEFIPFTISTENTITTSQTLNLHFEVYNLTQNEKGLHEFAVQYSYKKNKKNRIRGLFSGEKGNQYSLTYTSETPDYKTNLEVKLDRLEPGDYELELVVTDLTNGESVTRTTKVTAVEEQD